MSLSKAINEQVGIEKAEFTSLSDLFDFLDVKLRIEWLIFSEGEVDNILNLWKDISIYFEKSKEEINRLISDNNTRHHLSLLTFKPKFIEEIDNFIRFIVILTKQFQKDNLIPKEIKDYINIKIIELEEIFEKEVGDKYPRKHHPII